VDRVTEEVLRLLDLPEVAQYEADATVAVSACAWMPRDADLDDEGTCRAVGRRLHAKLRERLNEWQGRNAVGVVEAKGAPLEVDLQRDKRKYCVVVGLAVGGG
jgi:hypothetical protein